jgi:hypothetical protein
MAVGVGGANFNSCKKCCRLYTYTCFMLYSLFSVQRLEELEEIDCWKKVNSINYILKLVTDIFVFCLIIWCI